MAARRDGVEVPPYRAPPEKPQPVQVKPEIAHTPPPVTRNVIIDPDLNKDHGVDEEFQLRKRRMPNIPYNQNYLGFKDYIENECGHIVERYLKWKEDREGEPDVMHIMEYVMQFYYTFNAAYKLAKVEDVRRGTTYYERGGEMYQGFQYSWAYGQAMERWNIDPLTHPRPIWNSARILPVEYQPLPGKVEIPSVPSPQNFVKRMGLKLNGHKPNNVPRYKFAVLNGYHVLTGVFPMSQGSRSNLAEELANLRSTRAMWEIHQRTSPQQVNEACIGIVGVDPDPTKTPVVVPRDEYVQDIQSQQTPPTVASIPIATRSTTNRNAKEIIGLNNSDRRVLFSNPMRMKVYGSGATIPPAPAIMECQSNEYTVGHMERMIDGYLGEDTKTLPLHTKVGMVNADRKNSHTELLRVITPDHAAYSNKGTATQVLLPYSNTEDAIFRALMHRYIWDVTVERVDGLSQGLGTNVLNSAHATQQAEQWKTLFSKQIFTREWVEVLTGNAVVDTMIPVYGFINLIGKDVLVRHSNTTSNIVDSLTRFTPKTEFTREATYAPGNTLHRGSLFGATGPMVNMATGQLDVNMFGTFFYVKAVPVTIPLLGNRVDGAPDIVNWTFDQDFYSVEVWRIPREDIYDDKRHKHHHINVAVDSSVNLTITAIGIHNLAEEYLVEEGEIVQVGMSHVHLWSLRKETIAFVRTIPLVEVVEGVYRRTGNKWEVVCTALDVTSYNGILAVDTLRRCHLYTSEADAKKVLKESQRPTAEVHDSLKQDERRQEEIFRQERQRQEDKARQERQRQEDKEEQRETQYANTVLKVSGMVVSAITGAAVLKVIAPMIVVAMIAVVVVSTVIALIAPIIGKWFMRTSPV